MNETYNGLTYNELLGASEKAYGRVRYPCSFSWDIVNSAIGWHRMCEKFAMTNDHPAVTKLDALLPGLSDSEYQAYLTLVGKPFNAYASYRLVQ